MSYLYDPVGSVLLKRNSTLCCFLIFTLLLQFFLTPLKVFLYMLFLEAEVKASHHTELFSFIFRQRRRSRATRCWWVGSWCRVPVVRSRSTASSCHSLSCREFTVCCGPERHLPCDPACCTNTPHHTTTHHQLGSLVSTPGPNMSNQEVFQIANEEITT